MRLRQTPASRREPDLTGLINVIFLILIFFLIAGTLRPFSAADLTLPKAGQASVAHPGPGRLLVHANGDLIYRNRALGTEPSELAAIIEADKTLDRAAPFTLILDSKLDAHKAMDLIATLNAGRISNVQILTERSDQ